MAPDDSELIEDSPADFRAGVQITGKNVKVSVIGIGKRPKAPPEDNTHVLSIQLRALGGTVMANETALILDPDTGEQIGDPLIADENGYITAIVPDGREYHIKIVEEDKGDTHVDSHEAAQTLQILATFTKPDQTPIKGEKVSVKQDDNSFDLTTDDEGGLHIPAAPGLTTLTLGSQTFSVHPILLTEEAAPFRFVVTA